MIASKKELERIQSTVIRRLQAAGAEGISASDFGPMMHGDFPDRTPNALRSLLIRMANAGKIFRKAVSLEYGGLQSHYFLQADWCDAYVKNALPSRILGQPAPTSQPTIPKFGIVEHRDTEGIELGKGVTLKPGVKVQVLTPFFGDYRIKVDPLSCPRLVDSNQCREWAKA